MTSFRRASGLLIFALLLASAPAFAAPKSVDRDLDGDGRKESKVFYEKNQIQKIQMDRNADKNPDAWVLFKDGNPLKGERDLNFDGRVDTWMDYDANGRPTRVARDRRRKDGKPDTWVYMKNGQIYLREWDRNFDGKADLRSLEDDAHHLLEKQYDDDFDGRFERTVKPPPHGSSGRPDFSTTP